MKVIENVKEELERSSKTTKSKSIYHSTFVIKHADSKINGAGNDLIHTFEKQLEVVENMETDEVKANDSDSDCDPEDENMVARVKERLPGPAEKIDAYSNDAAAVESKSKPASRKSGPTFEPREVIEYLAGHYRNGESKETQLMAVKMYFKLKKLMYDFDEICDSSDDETTKAKTKSSLTSQLEMEAKMLQKTPKKMQKDNLDSVRDKDGEEKQVQASKKVK
ncbi:unnamed protein product [Oikopleura dioica]|uniref:Uncharacterized protein n=1 Tax=Oikopleura dioica TaxID=34765 RepID=E4XP14_OIKDI|nr:unnamed protein product [Oikopleura dioica]